MTYQEINTLIESVGVPSAYYQFTADTAVPPPFICFYFDNDPDLYADNVNYQKIAHLVIELYTDEKDFDLESTMESTLNTAGISYARNETYIDSEKLYLVTYSTDMIITQEENTNA